MNRGNFIPNIGIMLLCVHLSACGPAEQSSDSNAETHVAVDAAAAADAPLEITVTQFPNAYFGRWGMTPGDCEPGASDVKGLISVQGSLVKFYESTAVMRNGKRETMTSVSADFDVEGEGEKWQTHTRYRLADDRKQLIRQDVGTPGEYVYTRCQD
ncbi:MAG: hypothetical protein ABI668_05585 [Sphingorhabdus sp.]